MVVTIAVRVHALETEVDSVVGMVGDEPIGDRDVDVARVVSAPVTAPRVSPVVGLGAVARADVDVEIVLLPKVPLALAGGDATDKDLEWAGDHD